MLHHYPTRLLELIVRRRGTHVDGLAYQRLELVEFQRTVVQGGGQTETVLHEVDFAGAVAAVHCPNLRHRDVTFINYQDEIVREKVQNAERTHSRVALVEIAGIVLDTGAVAQLLHHLHIIGHTVFQPFGFQVFADGFEIIPLLTQIQYNLVDRLVHRLLRGHEDAGGIYDNILLLGDDSARGSLDDFQRLNLIVPENDAESMFVIRRENIDGIAFHAELTGLQIQFGTGVETSHKLQ